MANRPLAVVWSGIMDDFPHLSRWRLHMTAQRLSHRTITDRIQLIARASEATGAAPHALQADDLIRWASSQRWTPSTSQTYYSTLVAWHRWLRREGIRVDDPMDMFPKPRTPRAVPRPITTRQLAALLATRMHHRTRGMILLAALAGLRVHEVAKFRGDDCAGEVLWVQGKGGTLDTVPAHPMILDFAATMPASGFWFTTHVGTNRGRAPVSPKSVSTIIGQAMRRAGVNGTAHQLRHWYGTTLLDAGADLRTTQSLLRHASVATTERYTKVRDSRRVRAVQLLDPFHDEPAELAA